MVTKRQHIEQSFGKQPFGCPAGHARFEPLVRYERLVCFTPPL
jgi:hypothetical protein